MPLDASCSFTRRPSTTGPPTACDAARRRAARSGDTAPPLRGDRPDKAESTSLPWMSPATNPRCGFRGASGGKGQPICAPPLKKHRAEADVKIEYQATSKHADAAARLAGSSAGPTTSTRPTIRPPPVSTWRTPTPRHSWTKCLRFRYGRMSAACRSAPVEPALAPADRLVLFVLGQGLLAGHQCSTDDIGRGRGRLVRRAF